MLFLHITNSHKSKLDISFLLYLDMYGISLVKKAFTTGDCKTYCPNILESIPPMNQDRGVITLT
jgi:hypothetical protein